MKEVTHFPGARRLLAGALALTLLLAPAGCGKAEEEEEKESAGTPKIGYAEGTVAVEDQDALQKALDEANERAKDMLTLEYKNGAFSEDGKTFTCYLANAAENNYDAFFSMYTDAELTDEIFLSGLLRPGTAFDTIELSRTLESGTHRLFVAQTQVEEDLETIHGQIVFTMDFTVT